MFVFLNRMLIQQNAWQWCSELDLKVFFLSTRNRLIYPAFIVSRIARGMMTELNRQNLGKSTLKLRILCLAFIITTVSVVSTEDACSVYGFAENDQQRLCFHEDKKINQLLCCVAIDCPKGKEILFSRQFSRDTICVFFHSTWIDVNWFTGIIRLLAVIVCHIIVVVQDKGNNYVDISGGNDHVINSPLLLWRLNRM